MTEFCIVTGFVNKGETYLPDRVNEKLAQGWQCLGTIVYNHSDYSFSQAMTREVDVNPAQKSGKRSIQSEDIKEN